MARCYLCHNERQLRNSHIIPEFLYEKLYNSKGHMMAINGIGNRGYKPLQNGEKEYLFCDDCERLFNDWYEKPFLMQWARANPLPNPWSDLEAIHWIQSDYKVLKMFHLSVLFRASVSSLPTFSEVSLGSHEEKIRKILLDNVCPNRFEYPIFGHAVVHHESLELIHVVTKPIQSKLDGHRCFAFIYGGVRWWISVSSHRNLKFEVTGLREDGRMPFHATSWNQLEIFQEASAALRGHGNLRKDPL